jgi:hypothetical protein
MPSSPCFLEREGGREGGTEGGMEGGREGKGVDVPGAGPSLCGPRRPASKRRLLQGGKKGGREGGREEKRLALGRQPLQLGRGEE